MRAVAVMLMSLVMCGVAGAQTTKPSGASLEVAANEAFGAGKYAMALPMLTTLADKYKNEPDRLGPVKEKISVCQKQIAALTGASADLAGGAAGQSGPAVPMSAEARKPHAKPKAGEVAAMSIPELGNFEYDAEKGGNIPKDVTELGGSKIRVHGFMIPMDQADRITRFALVPSLFACCFGQPPQIQHTIVVQCPEGKAVSYFPDEINVEGTLKVNEKKEDGFIVSIFEMDVSSVKPAAK
jgi:hypothetical protein